MSIRKSNLLVLKIVAALITFLGQSNAAIISLDDPVYGPRSITRDELSGLEWLDWTVTTGRSYNDVSSQCRPGADFPGFRHATLKELLELYANMGIRDVNAPTPPNIGGQH